jgi:hypothetical protein
VKASTGPLRSREIEYFKFVHTLIAGPAGKQPMHLIGGAASKDDSSQRQRERNLRAENPLSPLYVPAGSHQRSDVHRDGNRGITDPPS